MKKTFFITVLALLMGFGMIGSAGAEEGVTDTEIVIGSHQDLSGPAAAWGTQVKKGLEMRAREINEAGGIHGRKIRLVIEDNAYDPKKAIMVTNKMIARDKVFAFICNMGSATAGATKELISKKKIPQMYPISAASLFYDPYDRYSFGGALPYYDQARSLVKYFVEQKGYTKIGLMYQDDDLGAPIKQGMEDQLRVHNLPLVAVSYKRGATDFSSQIGKLKKADVQFVVLGTSLRETVGALKEARKINWKVDMGGTASSFSSFVIDLSLAAGFSPDGYYAVAVGPYVYPDSPLEKIRALCEKFKQWYGEYPQQQVRAGLTGISFFAAFAEKVGRDLTREKWIDAAESYGVWKDEKFAGADIEFTPTNHQGGFDGILHQIQNNRFVKIADISYR